MPSQDDKTQFIVLGRKEHHDNVPAAAATIDTSNVMTPSIEDVTRIMTTNLKASDTQRPTAIAFDIDDFFGSSHNDMTTSTEDSQASSEHEGVAINFANQAPQSNSPQWVMKSRIWCSIQSYKLFAGISISLELLRPAKLLTAIR